VNDPPLPPVHLCSGMRRTLFAFTLSLAVHAGFVATTLAVAAWRGLSLAPPVRLAAIAIDVRELPLGGSRPTGAKADGEGPAHPVRRPRPARVRTSHTGVAVALAPDAGSPDGSAEGGQAAPDAGHEAGSGHRRPGDLRSYGPEGSRLTALLRLDRLRASPRWASYQSAIDQLLLLLPDRRRLLDGTGLDLYRDFDALLIATPEPRNDKVTFLAARHRLKDTTLQAALDRGAAATGHAIEWRLQDGRPVGVRRMRAAVTGQATGFDLDDRILVLPQPSLAVMAPPAYAEQLLGRPARPGSRQATLDAGTSDAGAADARPTPSGKSRGRIAWRDLVARIDAEDSALPEDAVFMITAVNLFVLPAAPLVVPGTRGVVDDDVRATGPYGPAPQALTLVAGIDPEPYLELVGEFADESQARVWERDFPSWKGRLMLNPVLFLAGFAPLVDRAELSREERILFVRASTTAEELQRLLAVATNAARAIVGRPH
jgi:hypothetical protein